MSFDHRFAFRKEGNTLFIEKSEALQDDFFGKGMYSVSAIVGSNGAGKTSVLRFLMEAVVDGFNNGGVDGVVIYESDGKLLVYQPDYSRYRHLKIVSEVAYSRLSTLLPVPVLYYSGHFSPYIDRNDILSSELKGSYIASDQWLLIHDLLSYTDYDSHYLLGRMFGYLSAYNAQNNARICELLLLEGLDTLLDDLRLPRYILIRINNSGAEYLANSIYEKIEVPGFKPLSKNARQNQIARFIYANFINLIAENRSLAETFVSILDEWQSVSRDGDILDTFEVFIHQKGIVESVRPILKTLHHVLRLLFTICQYDSTTNVFFFDVAGQRDQLRRFIDNLLNSHFYLTSKFFDIYYSHGLYSNTILSSGEQEMLNLLSRLYYGIAIRTKHDSTSKTPTLILLDEAEIGFHPEWQRKYINLLIQFLTNPVIVDPDYVCQLVITSHSPIILSDLPMNCVTILEKDDKKNTVVKTDESQTFGENVFNLYRRAFVMKEGLVGAFASRKIKSLFERIRGGETGKDVLKELLLIGDDRIRGFLQSEIEKKRRESMEEKFTSEMN